MRICEDILAAKWSNCFGVLWLRCCCVSIFSFKLCIAYFCENCQCVNALQFGLLCQEKAKSVKRSGSGSVASVTSERSECDSDGWVTATCWVVPGRRGCGGTMGRILSAVM